MVGAKYLNISQIRKLQILTLVGCSLTSLTLSPKTNYEAAGVTKLYVMVTVFFFIFGVLSWKNFIRIQRSKTVALWLPVFFVVTILGNLFLHGYALSERIFGVSQRYNGAVTNFALCMVFVIAYSLYNTNFLSLFFKFLGITNIAIVAYYYVQRFGFDFFSFEEAYASPSSTLGNPNFVSGFLGLSSLSWYFFYRLNPTRSKMSFALVYFIISTITVLDTKSIQGVFVALIVLLVFVLNQAYFTSFYKFIFFSGLTIAIAALSSLGFAGIGPLSTLLQSSTLFSRFDYWRAAVAMLIKNPLTGVGLDGFGDHYRMFRDTSALNRFGEGQVSDSPHNVFLDYFAAGGVFLGLIHLLFFLIVFTNVIRAIIRLRKSGRNIQNEHALACILAMHCGYMAFSMFSPFSLGVASWGWLILGIANGIVIPMNAGISNELTTEHRKKAESSRLRQISSLALVVLAPFVAAPPLIADHNFLVAANKGDGMAITRNVMNWPMDSKRIVLVAQGHVAGENFGLAKEVIDAGLRFNQNSFELWVLLESNPLSSGLEKRLAARQISRLGGLP